MLLRDSPYKGRADFPLVLRLARAGQGADAHGYRAAFTKLVEKARAIKRRK